MGESQENLADSAIPAVKVHPNEIGKSRHLMGQENEKQSQFRWRRKGSKFFENKII
jgi:hypothetical protein